MKSLYESLVTEEWDPESYGGAALGAGFYVQADHKEGYTAGGELDIKIQGQKIIIKEKKSVGDKAHRVEVDIEKPGTYNFDIQADCDISLYIYSEKAVKGINIATSGKPITNLFTPKQNPALLATLTSLTIFLRFTDFLLYIFYL